MVAHEYLLASGKPVGVDKEAGVINGYVVAQAGDFKTGRGTFNSDSLAAIVDIINASPDGVVVNYGHQNDVGSNAALDAFLGRARNARVDGDKARADLHLNPVALSKHGGTGLGDRLMMRAETDPASFASSLVVAADKQKQRSGPPLWKPLAIMSSDMVYVGDAVHGGILAAEDTEGQDDEARIRLRNLKRKATA